jgi:hypothetical protein
MFLPAVRTIGQVGYPQALIQGIMVTLPLAVAAGAPMSTSAS